MRSRASCPGEEQLLASSERPIVLLRQWLESGLAPEVAPGNPLVGLLLAYTPLHHLLLAEAGRPLVMTSGNLSDEPMAAADAEALERLAGIADLFLAHDRAIENRCDDSVARVIAGSPTILRRARGYVPRPVRSPARCGGRCSPAAPSSRTPSAWPRAARPGSARTSATSTTSRRRVPSRSRSSGCSDSWGSGPS